MPKIQIDADKSVDTRGKFVRVGQTLSPLANQKNQYTVLHFLPGTSTDEASLASQMAALNNIRKLAQIEYPYYGIEGPTQKGYFPEGSKPLLAVHHIQKAADARARMGEKPRNSFDFYLKANNLHATTFSKEQLEKLKLLVSEGATGKLCGVTISKNQGDLSGTFVPSLVVFDPQGKVIYAEMTTDFRNELNVDAANKAIQADFSQKALEKKESDESDERNRMRMSPLPTAESDADWSWGRARVRGRVRNAAAEVEGAGAGAGAAAGARIDDVMWEGERQARPMLMLLKLKLKQRQPVRRSWDWNDQDEARRDVERRLMGVVGL